jgi:hypothetical protein
MQLNFNSTPYFKTTISYQKSYTICKKKRIFFIGEHNSLVKFMEKTTTEEETDQVHLCEYSQGGEGSESEGTGDKGSRQANSRH